MLRGTYASADRINSTISLICLLKRIFVIYSVDNYTLCTFDTRDMKCHIRVQSKMLGQHPESSNKGHFL